MIRLLIYSQDLNLQSLLAPTLGGEFSVILERRIERVREIISKEQCDVLILDLNSSSYPIQQQFRFFEELREFGVPVVVMTDDDSRATAMDLVQRGVYNYVRKPPALPELKIVVRRAHEYAVLKRELEDIRSRLPPSSCGELVGSSARSQVVYDLVRRVADREASVLITGESGTGKELIARSIHNLSHRKGRPFVAVSPAGLFPRLSSRRNCLAPRGEHSLVPPADEKAIWKRPPMERCFSTRSGNAARTPKSSCFGYYRRENSAAWEAASRFRCRQDYCSRHTEVCLRWWRKEPFARISITESM